MNQNSSIIKIIALALSAIFISHKLSQGEELHHPTKKLSPQEGWQPLAPIRKRFWLVHPQRALSFFLLQQSLGVTYKLAKKFFSSHR